MVGSGALRRASPCHVFRPHPTLSALLSFLCREKEERRRGEEEEKREGRGGGEKKGRGEPGWPQLQAIPHKPESPSFLPPPLTTWMVPVLGML